jgi:hypothetical protein
MILLARHTAGAAFAAYDDAALFGMDFDGIAVQSGELGGENEGASGFVEVDGRCPPGGIGSDELTELLVKCEQIPDGIPPRESHGAS